MADGAQVDPFPATVEHAAAANPETCFWCRQPVVLELLEIWGDRAFQIETCCEGLHEEVARFLSDDPRAGAALLRDMGIEAIMGRRLRSVAPDNCCGLILDWKLELDVIEQKDAKAFVRLHHAHHKKPPAGWRFGGAVRNGGDIMGVVMVGRPVARMLDRNAVVEANRVCVRRDLPDALRHNACSMLYGFAAREAKRRRFKKIITYILESESGASLLAAGWECEGPAGGGSWHRKSRPRVDSAPTELKVRWSKHL